jgi:hypothetical protein
MYLGLIVLTLLGRHGICTSQWGSWDSLGVDPDSVCHMRNITFAMGPTKPCPIWLKFWGLVEPKISYKLHLPAKP